MPDAPPDPLAVVLRRHRRRWRFARLADAAFVAGGVGGLGAVAAMTFGVGPLGPLLLGAAVAFALARRPTPTLADAAAWLDTRHGLQDLLGTAWALHNSPRDPPGEPWAAVPGAMAAGRIAGLPPTGRLTRFSARHHVCLMAAGVAVWLGGGLARSGESAGPASGAVASVSTDATEARRTADVVRRAADTATSESRGPSPPDGGASSDPPSDRPVARPADAANGQGQADADTLARLLPPAGSSISVSPNQIGPGGTGRAAVWTGPGETGGTVDPGSGRVAGRATIVGDPQNEAERTAPAGGRSPEAYRELVQDFFAR